MNITVDLTPISEFFALPPEAMFLRVILLVGWIPIAIAFLWGALHAWINYIQGKWAATNKFVLLAIDIPRSNVQTPKAVENLITYLAGAHGSINLIEKYWIGKFQLSFSLEIVSIEGYIQYLIRTSSQFRDLVEAAIYSQYPDAEITEIEDYVNSVPSHYPDEEYDLWGAEFIHAKGKAYPIKTYAKFLDLVPSKEQTVQFKDPISSLMTLMSSLGKGEQLWYQIIVKPIDMMEWTAAGDKEIAKILGEKIQNSSGRVVDTIVGWIESFSEFVYRLWGDIKKKEKEAEQFKMFNLKPREKKQIEAIQEKIGKVGFETKIRMIYAAKKDVMNKPKVSSGFVGFMKQYADLDLNNLKPDMKVTATSAHYFFIESRLNAKKNKLIRGYRGRDIWAGRVPGILNIEEIASIWHFPIELITPAPMLQKTSARKVEPPMSLPTEEEAKIDFSSILGAEEEPAAPLSLEEEIKKDEVVSAPEKISNGGVSAKAAPPDNLPFA